MNSPKPTGIAQMGGQVPLNSRREIRDIDIEFCEMFNFAHVAAQCSELAEALYCKRFTRNDRVHPEAIIAIVGDEFYKRFVKSRDCCVIDITSSENEDRSKPPDEMLEVNWALRSGHV